MSNKVAILSMDIEDWYHLDYFDSLNCDKNYTLLDGVNNYLNILDDFNLPSNFFVLGEIAGSLKLILRQIKKLNHDIGSHGWTHERPITMSKSSFSDELKKSKLVIEDIINDQVDGYRAPCFSLDRERLDLVKKAGFLYDSSRIDFNTHPLYNTIEMNGFNKNQRKVYFDNKGFFEFEVSTVDFIGRKMPISGGGYIRIFPWKLYEYFLRTYLRSGQIFIFYIHPFELSNKSNPKFNKNISWLNKRRFSYGRKTTMKKLVRLIELLKSQNYSFMTFTELRKEIILKNKF
tara:strand:- start:575 stop:1441 length:867 start_codon:yes stop_codon:yes gene_type:complete